MINMNVNKTEIAVLGGGCFWCTEAIYQNIRGIISVTSGYSGGQKENPTYEEVCTGRTGHAEVIKLEFDPQTISYRDILEIFFATHDPTTLNKQGADTGEQYRSIIFYASEAQMKTALAYIKELESKKIYRKPIVTQIVEMKPFYTSEDYHRNYYNNNRGAPYCEFVITPKMEKLFKKFGDRIKGNNLTHKE